MKTSWYVAAKFRLAQSRIPRFSARHNSASRRIALGKKCRPFNAEDHPLRLIKKQRTGPGGANHAL